MGIIETLKTEGVLTFHHDYRARHSDDLSGNDVSFTVNGNHSYGRDGRTPDTTGSNLSTADNSLDFDASGEMTVALLIKGGQIQGGGDSIIRNALYTTSGYYLQITNGGKIFFKEDDSSAGYSSVDSGLIKIGQISSVILTYNNQTVKIYVDGIDQALDTAGTPVWVSDVGSDFIIGDGFANDNFLGEYGAALHVSRVITATEASQLHSELINGVWPAKTESRRTNIDLLDDKNDTSLVGGYEIRNDGGTVYDVSGNGNDMTVSGNPVSAITPFKDGMDFNTTTAGYLVKATFNNAPSTAITISAWVKMDTFQDWNNIVAHDGWASVGSWLLYIDASGRLLFGIIDGGGQNNAIKTGLTTGVWYHIVGTYDGTTVNCYVDGVIGGSVSVTQALDTTVDIDIGDPMLGSIAGVKIYNEAKDQAWITNEYEKGASAVQYKPDYGINVSTANVSAGELENTGWTVDSGNCQMSTDTIDGVDVKTLACQTDNSVISIPVDKLGMTGTEGIYGTWEFWWYKFDGNNVIFVNLNTEKDATGDGYQFRFGAQERFRLRRITSGGAIDQLITNASFFNIGQWYKMKITRSNSGVWTFYADDILISDIQTGSNPVTDNTHTSINYISILGRATDLVAFADVKGDHSFVKKLGVV